MTAAASTTALKVSSSCSCGEADFWAQGSGTAQVLGLWALGFRVYRVFRASLPSQKPESACRKLVFFAWGPHVASFTELFLLNLQAPRLNLCLCCGLPDAGRR